MISISKYYYNKDYFSSINSSDKAYWLGFLYADGSINRYYKNDKLKSMSLEISLSDKDAEHLVKFRECIESNVPIHHRSVVLDGKEHRCSRINICCTKLCYDLIKLGCTPNKTFSIRLPDENAVPHRYMRDFLRGFFDGDGCVSVTTMFGKPHIVVTLTGVFDMMNDVLDYLTTVGIVRKVIPIIRDKRSYACSLRINGPDVIYELYDYLYKDATLFLDRKKNAFDDFYKDYNYKTEKIGVYWDKNTSSYCANIYIDGKKHVLGYFKNIDDAIERRKIAEVEKMNLNKAP